MPFLGVGQALINRERAIDLFVDLIVNGVFLDVFLRVEELARWGRSRRRFHSSRTLDEFVRLNVRRGFQVTVRRVHDRLDILSR